MAVIWQPDVCEMACNVCRGSKSSAYRTKFHFRSLLSENLTTFFGVNMRLFAGLLVDIRF